MPHNVAGYVCDKSSFARVFVSAFNTLFDPGFEGNATLELVNLGPETVEIKAGDPICQLVFHWLDQETDRPYRGKYMHQPKRPIGALYEDESLLPLVADTQAYEAVRIESPKPSRPSLGKRLIQAAKEANEIACDPLTAAARALLVDVRSRYPGEELRCPHMRAIDAIVNPLPSPFAL